MFNTFSRQKIALIGITLLIVGTGVLFLVRPGAAAEGLGLIVRAWESAFGGFETDGLALETSLSSSSTISGSLGQENAPLEKTAAWPSLLIEKKEVSRAPAIATETKVSVPALIAPPQWCDFFAPGRAGSGVILNEIAWMGSGQSPNDEWLEIKNTSGPDINIDGWQILNRSGSIKINIGDAGAMSPGSFLLLERDMDYSGALVNSGDHLKIFDSDCDVIDELDASSGWPAGDNATKKTLERDASGDGWHTSADIGGSPAAENSVIAVVASSTSTSVSEDSSVATTSIPVATSTAGTSTPTSTQDIPPLVATSTTTYPPGHLVIASAQMTGGEGMTDRDHIKIFNPTPGSIDVSGWKLRKRTKTGTESSIKVFPDGSVVAPGGYFIWANSADGWSATLGANVSSTQTIAADNSIALLDAGGALVDALAWGSGHIGPYIEGSPYPENPGANQQLLRKFEGGNIQDTGQNSLDFKINP